MYIKVNEFRINNDGYTNYSPDFSHIGMYVSVTREFDRIGPADIAKILSVENSRHITVSVEGVSIPLFAGNVCKLYKDRDTFDIPSDDFMEL